MKIEIKGFIHYAFTPVTTTGKNGNYTKQQIIIRKPGFTDEFGDKKGKDNYFPVWLNDQQIKKHATDLQKGKKVEVTAFLNGFEYNGNDGIQYGLSINVHELKFIP